MANPFAGMNGTKPNAARNGTMSDGKYKVKVDKCLFIDTDNGNRAFICEFEIVESSDTEKHPVGHKRSWYCGVNKSFKANVKGFCLAACGYDLASPDLDNLSEDIMAKAINDKYNCMKGRELSLTCVTKPQKEDKTKTFTHFNWGPASPAIPLDTLKKLIALPD